MYEGRHAETGRSALCPHDQGPFFALGTARPHGVNMEDT